MPCPSLATGKASAKRLWALADAQIKPNAKPATDSDVISVSRRITNADFSHERKACIISNSSNATPPPAIKSGHAASSACCCTSQTPTANANTNTRIKIPAAEQSDSA
jgi:hypothetical protein